MEFHPAISYPMGECKARERMYIVHLTYFLLFLLSSYTIVGSWLITA